ncbi:MAG: hypothetical protein KZQ66_06010, partial [Candidatus Thiodiazotropha sp. (ex Lucinoma aequizonata)]|nr:hypothetical protein [Candidatus Thiodiazotropha sp. (ex Lucinoma aequizonata)]MCU7896610.1 hypothetical protein [Candidatus Thiodiazotropha sp. (ex Lucinoma aequizonata)]MCU7899012.1 hypothetical protein [Candidatus Thiodiazotropha sp. (ex Lucinoma aequizonata)]MCU7901597.1 hypothetical protein [Candidatus Thiodiazotropha sp. (ex Lucinoma aequizonata)]MCU7907717.1 hypothetical protein [Candidatus Thiodiazotropha sp. (ex Lucinoma aequizonata)]
LSVAIPAIQPRLRLSGTNRLRSAFHGGQRLFRKVTANRPLVRTTFSAYKRTLTTMRCYQQTHGSKITGNTVFNDISLYRC